MDSYINTASLQSYFDKMTDHKKPISLEISSFKSTFHYHYQKTDQNKPFHLFGVSKLFTVALIDQLIQHQLLKLDRPIHHYIQESLLKNLFTFRNEDYMHEVTITHLLTHTSGIADYFDAILDGDMRITTEIEKNPAKRYHPMALMDITRTYQTALGVPGERFYYSDTGYVLLGLIIESVTNLSFQEALHQYVLTPLGLKDTYLYQGEQDVLISDVIYNKTNIAKHQSLTAHYAGSGIVSTHEDLKIFAKAIFKDGWLKHTITLNDTCCNHNFSKGMMYGMGCMTLDLHKLPFLVRTQKLPTLYGHMSFYGTHLWYEPNKEVLITLNYGTSKLYEKGFKVIAKIMHHIDQQSKEA